MNCKNYVCLRGNVGQEPEVKYMPDGTPVLSFNLAMTERWKDGKGEKQERTTWIKVSCFKGLAETCQKYVGKGDTIEVEGKLVEKKWEKEGQAHRTYEVRARSVDFLISRNRGEGSGGTPGPADDDVPF